MFKDEATQNWLTQALFLELSYGNTKYAMYTLKDEDYKYKGKIYKSIKKLYLECKDPTEYKFATTYLGGWQHWKRICDKTKNLHPYIEEWREELEIKLRSLGVKMMIEHALSDKGQQAAKWLAEKGYADKKRGRPSKEEVTGERKKQARISNDLASDLERIKELRH